MDIDDELKKKIEDNFFEVMQDRLTNWPPAFSTQKGSNYDEPLELFGRPLEIFGR